MVRETGAEFAVVGRPDGVRDALGLDQLKASGWVPLAAYPTFLAQLDVGIVPLAPTVFNRAKSWLTGLLMASVGVAFVASAAQRYQQLAAHGAGLLAAKPKDWQRQLTRLVRDARLRGGLAERGRQAAAELAIERHDWRWADAWHDARGYCARRAA